MNCRTTLRNPATRPRSFGLTYLPSRRPMRGQEAGPLFVLCALAAAGIFSAHAVAGQATSEKEIAVQEVQSEFKLQVQRNMVLVRVVVRDSKGNPVPNLRKEDFRLFDNGKPQEIDHFSVESTGGAPAAAPAATAKEAGEGGPSTGEASRAIPRNYQALYFDDTQMGAQDVAHARDAADRYLTRTLTPQDRAGIFTSSGLGDQDFTDDREKLHEALFRLQPRSRLNIGGATCPDIGEYQAYLIVERNDPDASAIANMEYEKCTFGEAQDAGLSPGKAVDTQTALARFVLLEATRMRNEWLTQAETVLRGLEEVVRRTAILPGQHNVIFISPGFLSSDMESRLAALTDRALRANVAISALDPRGLYTIIPGGINPGGDETKNSVVFLRLRPDLMSRKDQIIRQGLTLDEQVLAGLAADTGGRFFHNSNDLDQGFREVATGPEVYYLLTFSPHNLKFDGRFHNLKVSLANPGNYTLQARRGYFAPKASEDAATRAKEEIQQAAYSQDDLKDLPIDVHTQYYKLNDAEARLAVLTHLDISSVRFRQEKDLHLNKLTFLTVVFNGDGKCVVATEKEVELKLRDATLAKLAQTGITVKTEVDLKPGTYLLRQIVRDSEAGQLSGLSRPVEIPY
jgi:VWFA-related protein